MDKIEILPGNQIVYPWSLTDVDNSVKEGLLSSYKIIGDNIVLDDFNSLVSYNSSSISIRVQPGKVIQDGCLLNLLDEEVLTLDLSTLDATGILVGYIFFSSPSQEFKLGLVHLTSTGLGDWDSDNNKIVLDVYKFIKDTSNNVTSVYSTQQSSIEIDGNLYYKKGIHHSNLNISNVFNFLVRQNKYVKEDYLAEFNDLIFADTTLNAFTITLPENPPVGSHITIIDAAGTFWEHSLIVNPNGSKINNITTNQFFRFKHSVTDFYYSGEGWIYNVTRMWSLKGGSF